MNTETIYNECKRLTKPMECPKCKEIALSPIAGAIDNSGRRFMQYECTECKAEVTV